MSKILLVLMILVFTITLFSYGEDNKVTLDVDKELANYRENCAKIKSFLENEDSWKDAYFHLNKKKAEEIIAYLNIAKSLKVEGIGNLLVGKIDYEPNVVIMAIGFKKQEDAYPVYAALSEMNLDIVVPLVKLIRQANWPDQGASVSLAVKCLIKLYEKDGTGKEMAKKRLELELEKATESEKNNIKKALGIMDSL